MSADAVSMMTALTLLDVTPVRFDDGTDGLMVDTSKLADSEHGPRGWQLEYDGDGQWSHPPSGTSGGLGHMLWSIARSYQAFWPVEGEA